MDQPKKNPGRPKNAQNKHPKKIYTENDLQLALTMLNEDPNASVRNIASKMNIPEATLRRRKNVKKEVGIFGCNNKMLLTPAEEELLKGWIIKQAQRGFLWL